MKLFALLIATFILFPVLAILMLIPVVNIFVVRWIGEIMNEN